MREKERFEILQEHMDRKFDVILEGHQVLHREIKQTREEARIDRESIKQQLSLVAQTLVGKIEKNREKIEQVDQKVGINREKIEQLDKKVEINRRKIEEVDNKVEINRNKIEEVDIKLSTNLENHEDRIKILEAIN